MACRGAQSLAAPPRAPVTLRRLQRRALLASCCGLLQPGRCGSSPRRRQGWSGGAAAGARSGRGPAPCPACCPTAAWRARWAGRPAGWGRGRAHDFGRGAGLGARRAPPAGPRARWRAQGAGQGACGWPGAPARALALAGAAPASPSPAGLLLPQPMTLPQLVVGAQRAGGAGERRPGDAGGLERSPRPATPSALSQLRHRRPITPSHNPSAVPGRGESRCSQNVPPGLRRGDRRRRQARLRAELTSVTLAAQRQLPPPMAAPAAAPPAATGAAGTAPPPHHVGFVLECKRPWAELILQGVEGRGAAVRRAAGHCCAQGRRAGACACCLPRERWERTHAAPPSGAAETSSLHRLRPLLLPLQGASRSSAAATHRRRSWQGARCGCWPAVGPKAWRRLPMKWLPATRAASLWAGYCLTALPPSTAAPRHLPPTPQRTACRRTRRMRRRQAAPCLAGALSPRIACPPRSRRLRCAACTDQSIKCAEPC